MTTEIAARILNEFREANPLGAWDWQCEHYHVSIEFADEHPTVQCRLVTHNKVDHATTSNLSILNGILLAGGLKPVVEIWDDVLGDGTKTFVRYDVPTDEEMVQMGLWEPAD